MWIWVKVALMVVMKMSSWAEVTDKGMMNLMCGKTEAGWIWLRCRLCGAWGI